MNVSSYGTVLLRHIKKYTSYLCILFFDLDLSIDLDFTIPYFALAYFHRKFYFLTLTFPCALDFTIFLILHLPMFI